MAYFSAVFGTLSSPSAVNVMEGVKSLQVTEEFKLMIIISQTLLQIALMRNIKKKTAYHCSTSRLIVYREVEEDSRARRHLEVNVMKSSWQTVFSKVDNGKKVSACAKTVTDKIQPKY